MTTATVAPRKPDLKPLTAAHERHTGDGPASADFRVPGLARDIRVKIASKQEELEQAFALLAANYHARGYDAESDQPYRFTPYHALPGTVTLVAKHEGTVVATLSLVPDNAILGLPMESIYGEEIAELRREGRRLVEVISLADQGLSPREFIAVFKALIRLAMQYHVSRGGDTWVITVNPRHRNFYQKALGFSPLGDQRSYPTVQGHPAEAYVLDRQMMKDQAPQMYREVFDEKLPASVLTAHRWSASRVRYFGGRSTQIEPEALEGLLETIEARGAAAVAA